jgi:hypothetical protein
LRRSFFVRRFDSSAAKGLLFSRVCVFKFHLTEVCSKLGRSHVLNFFVEKLPHSVPDTEQTREIE